MEPAPNMMPLSALQQRCAYELDKFQPEQPGDDRYCLEIFRRAIVDRDNESWAVLQEQFSSYVLYWFRCHSKRREALQIDTGQSYVDDTFRRLWQWGRNHSNEFRSLGGALKFLHLCLDASIIDHLRRYSRDDRVPLSEDRSWGARQPEEKNYDPLALWKEVRRILTDPREWRVIYLVYYEGCKPGEIAVDYSEEFPDEKEALRLYRNAMRRLRRSIDRETFGKRIGYNE